MMLGRQVGNRFIESRPDWSAMEKQRTQRPAWMALVPIIRVELAVQGRLAKEANLP